MLSKTMILFISNFCFKYYAPKRLESQLFQPKNFSFYQVLDFNKFK